MSRKISMRFLLLMAAIIFSAHQMSYAQVWLNNNYFGAGDIGYTNNTSPNFNITGIGIGTFTTNISAALHVNTNLTATNSGFNAGEVFRTDGPAGVTHAWRMYSGNAASGLKFSLLNRINTEDIYLGSEQDAPLMFFTNGSSTAPRMRIFGATESNQFANNGFGNIAINTDQAQAKLSVYNDNDYRDRHNMGVNIDSRIDTSNNEDFQHIALRVAVENGGIGDAADIIGISSVTESIKLNGVSDLMASYYGRVNNTPQVANVNWSTGMRLDVEVPTPLLVRV